MKIKHILWIILSAFSLTLASCSNDDKINQDYESQIIGSWWNTKDYDSNEDEWYYWSDDKNYLETYVFEFKSNGTGYMKEPNDDYDYGFIYTISGKNVHLDFNDDDYYYEDTMDIQIDFPKDDELIMDYGDGYYMYFSRIK